MITRRNLLGQGLAGLAAGSILAPSTAAASQRFAKKKPKNVIFCVVDGMPLSCLTLSDQYQQIVNGRRSYWASLMEEPEVTNGLQDVRSLSSVVTDSSAASSAWGCGRRIWNGQTNVYPDGTELATLTQLLAKAKVRCGLVTTATITHATPSGFAVNCKSRSLEGLIAERYADANVDILLGGGNKFFSASLRPDGLDLYQRFESAGFEIVRSKKELLASKSKKILGTFNDSHVPYTVDHVNSPDLVRGVPTLAEMARVAINALKDSPNGFLLQIEGAKVDHGCHGNDVAAAFFDQIAFEDAVKVAIDFAREDGETLVIITADHATGGLALNGAGSGYFDSTAGLLTLAGMKCTFAPLRAALGDKPKVSDTRDIVSEKLGIKLKEDEAKIVVDAIAEKSPYSSSLFLGGRDATLGVIFGNYSKVTFTSQNHTSDHVMVTAFGPGAEAMHGVTKNTDFFNLILDAWDMRHSNPEMSFEEAKKHFDQAKDLEPELLAQYADTSPEDAYHAV